MIFQKIFVWTTIFLILLTMSISGMTIELQDRAVVSGKDVLLKDLAVVTDCTENELERINLIYIGNAPLIGKSRMIDSNYIIARLLQAGISRASFQIKGAKRIQVETLFQILKPESIIEYAKNYIITTIGNSKQKIRLEPVQSIREIKLPLGEIEFKVCSSFSPQNYCKQFYVPVEIIVGGKQYQTIRVNFRIQRFEDVVIADEDINRHQVLTQSMLKIVEKEVSSLQERPFNQIETIIGKQTVAIVKKGSMLTSDMVEIIPLIKRGDIITIKNEIGPLVVTTLGKSQDDGMLGQKIRVQNLDSKTVVVGRVQDKQTIIIE